MKESITPTPASRKEEKENVQFYKLEEKFSTTYFRKQRLHDETRITSFTVAKQPITADKQDAEFETLMKSVECADSIIVDEILSMGLKFLTK